MNNIKTENNNNDYVNKGKNVILLESDEPWYDLKKKEIPTPLLNKILDNIKQNMKAEIKKNKTERYTKTSNTTNTVNTTSDPLSFKSKNNLNMIGCIFITIILILLLSRIYSNSK